MCADNVDTCNENGHNIFMNIQEKKRVHLLEMESIVVLAPVIITLKSNEPFDWVKLLN